MTATSQGCTIPPAGWICTRQPGHEGPCAAHQQLTYQVTIVPSIMGSPLQVTLGNPIRAALELLVWLKDNKDVDPTAYNTMKEQAWAAARLALSQSDENKITFINATVVP